MHADEAEIDAALVRSLIAAQFPRWAALPVERVASGGTVNAVFRLGDELSVRMPLTAAGAKDVDLEFSHLPRLAAGLPVPVPEPVAVGDPGAGYPWQWSVCRWLPGTILPPDAGVAAPGPLAGQLAGFVNAMRAADPAGGPPSYRSETLADRDAETRAALAQLKPEDGVDVPAVTAAWETALRAPAYAGPPVWLHADLSPGNILLTDDGRLGGVIDFGCMGLGEPAVDLIAAWNLFTGPAREAFRAAVTGGDDDAAWARGRGWALSISLIQLPYYRHTNPVMVASSKFVIDEVLADG
ncbi:aminoglycoside phosphotransferase family protein [Streptomyces sp. NBC_01808]|uniref:aminoglycoside phosphotransferase family protein n=1 Tax=Streptomyces sp. NBC_01808 TaxID=2975947 RepID=UPI002DDBA0C3|nr:aminoglycoside phosphotransferase family protein [Streptomyces sp. NBC_01808]WSA42494.1 aminoglycoside phosphotransferase family protein [Streptomyces sp. NBC_01808]